MYSFGTKSQANMQGIDPRLAELMSRAIKKSPIDFGIPAGGGKRTPEQQHELFVAGKSKCDGYKVKSNHQSGLAVDVFAYIDGKASWDREHLALVAGVVLSEAIQMGLKVRWGGEFGSKVYKGWDSPHFELVC
jgi:peptidoglycan LD-endopeptidase CwlK